MNAPPAAPIADWHRLSPLLDDALALPVDARDDWLARLPPALADLQPALARLLARAAVETDDFMRRPVRLRSCDLPAETTAVPEPGLLVGPYRLLREIGTGGMGTVWLAERADGALRRRVALKLPRLNWDARGLAERMARERDILAGLEHANIARLYDAGVDAQGRPFLAMEYVEGQPLDVFCNANALDVRGRLALFLQVARAVAHAHARLVVHRDLKPSNILVTANGEVRLLDFGVAKLIQGAAGAESAGESRLTRLGGRALTPEYAAPEQIRGEAITVAVDVYSLGIVLYELMAGCRPYALATGSATALEEAILNLDPPAASSLTPEKARARQLRGDLDTILAKALKKRPGERYATADAFAADIERYLAGAPVLARPDSLAYRASRFARRHPMPLGMALLVVLAVLGGAAPVAAVMTALAAGVGLALWQAGIARRQAARAADEARMAQRERDRAVALLERNEATLEMIQIMLTEAAAADERITLNELLARCEKLALATIGNHPEQQASVLDQLASVWTSYGDCGKAASLLQHAASLIRSSPDLTLRARIECNHALVLSECGTVEPAKRTIEGWLACAEVEPHVAALCQQYLAQIARNHNDAKGALVNVLGAQERLAASRRKMPLFEASLAGDIAYAYHLNGRTADADRQYDVAIRMHRDIGRGESPVAVAILNNWALSCLACGDVKRGLALIDDLLRIVIKRSPNGTPPVYAVNNRAWALISLARYDDAWTETERTWELADQSGAAIFKLNARVMQAMILRERGDVDGAETLLAGVATDAAGLPHDCFAVLSYRLGCAQVALLLARPDEAAASIEPVVRLFEERGMRVGVLCSALRVRAEIRSARGDLAGALVDARAALAIADELRAGIAFTSLCGLSWLLVGEIERAADHPRDADAALRAAITQLSAALGDDHPRTCRARALAGVAAAASVRSYS